MTTLIAEIGINHSGSEEKLYKMIRSLHEHKIDACKLQYRSGEGFFDDSVEMGSTLISEELDSANLDLVVSINAVQFARKLGLQVGVSFFRVNDAVEFCNLCIPDFFKVPSAEALNFELIRHLQNIGPPVIVSTGGLTYEQLVMLSAQIQFRPDDCVMYCVANYPVADGVANPSYLVEYKSIFDCKTGYSSHDESWEMNLAFLSYDIDFIERHYADDKNDEGLDISTSSDLAEICKLQRFCHLDLWGSNSSLRDKVPNQGELQNLKDLGSGYFFADDYSQGDEVSVANLLIKSPCRGIKAGSLTSEIKLCRAARAGDPLTPSHMIKGTLLSPGAVSSANELQISLPVRLHDFEEIDRVFEVMNYEWHLSYKEVPDARNILMSGNRDFLKSKRFSIHLPDYVSSNQLIDPFSSSHDVASKSRYLIDEVSMLAAELQDLTGYEVPIVGSFSVVNKAKSAFYGEYAALITEIFNKYTVKIMPQFLPKLAWYFGGAVKLDVFCHVDDIEFYSQLPFGICMDTAHCIMAANYYKQSPADWITRLLPLSGHIHISDAAGIDGEGVPFGDGDLDDVLDIVLRQESRKVVEQWEGHLNNFDGFKQSVNYLAGRIK